MAMNVNGLEYDKEREQYVLTYDFAKKNLIWESPPEVMYGNKQNFLTLLKEVSDDIYLLISSSTLLREMANKQILMKENEEIIHAIKFAMLYQLRYYNRTGGGLTKEAHGVDIVRNRILKIQDIRDGRHIALQAKQKLEQVGLLFQGLTHFRFI